MRTIDYQKKRIIICRYLSISYGKSKILKSLVKEFHSDQNNPYIYKRIKIEKLFPGVLQKKISKIKVI